MSVDRSAVEQQLAAIGEADAWWHQQEIRDLPDILVTDERILAIVRGRLATRFRRGRRWVILVTTQRLLCIRGGERFGRRQFELPMSKITAITQRTGLLRATITLATQGSSYRLRVRKDDALKLIGALSAVVNRIVAPGLPGAPVAFVNRDELARVHERVEMMEDELDRLRQQVDFLEDLLRRRSNAVPLPGAEARPSLLPPGSEPAPADGRTAARRP